MYSSQTQQEETSFNDERADITSELHTIVDNLQPDAPPQVASPRRPFWQRTGVWQVPLCLIAFAIIFIYNPRLDNCNGFKITYKQQVLCISNDADFFLFVENFTCDAIENGPSVIDSLVADEAASDKMKAYFEKYDFSIEKQPIEAEVLRGMRGQYDSASFCKNFTKACWNAGIRLLNAGQTDSACYYFNKIGTWSWGDSVLTATDKSVISQNCYGDFPPNQTTEKASIYPNTDFVEGECCTINYDNLGFRSKPLDAEKMRAVNNRTQMQKETHKSIAIDNETLIGTLRSGDKVFFLGKTGSFFKIRLEKDNQIGYIAHSFKGISTLIKGCNSSTPVPKGLNAVNDRLKNINNALQNRVNQKANRENQKENSRQLQTNDSALNQQKTPLEVPLKTYTYYTNGTSERDPSKLVKLENLEEIIIKNNIYDDVEVLFVLQDARYNPIWYITPAIVKILKGDTFSIKISKNTLNKYMATNKQLYLSEAVSGEKILSWPLKKGSMKK